MHTNLAVHLLLLLGFWGVYCGEMFIAIEIIIYFQTMVNLVPLKEFSNNDYILLKHYKIV